MINKFDTATTLATIIVAAFILVIFGWMFFPPSADAASLAVLNTLIGVLGTAFVAIVTFYFGSSKGSKDKDDTINQMAVGNSQNGATPPPPVAAPHAPVP